jgi:hypothetical protein
MRRSLSFLFIASSLALGCGGGGGGSDAGGGGDGGGNDPVLYDDHATSCTLSCMPGTVNTACTCTPVTFGTGFETVRTACSQIATGRARTPARDYCVDGAAGAPADISCMMTPPVAGASQMVTLYGVVEIFANGPDSGNITVDVFSEGADGALGAMMGTATSSTASPCVEMEELVDSMGMPTGTTRRLGFYAIPNIPTETPLIVRTTGDTGLWNPLYTYNFMVLNGDVQTGAPAMGACGDTPMGPRYEYRARVLSHSDYGSIPITAGLASGIPAGHGALAGEVHDCTDVRVEWAQVGVLAGDPAHPSAIGSRVYFNNIADNPLPNVSQTQGTSLLGLYAALDVAPGPVNVAAIGYVGGQQVSLGWYRARIFPDAVTGITLRGIRSFQAH